jgi:hypothetical protein
LGFMKNFVVTMKNMVKVLGFWEKILRNSVMPN